MTLISENLDWQDILAKKNKKQLFQVMADKSWDIWGVELKEDILGR
jgi:hypothetical protein